MFVKLAGRTVVVVGAGVVAEQKIDGLLAANARVKVIAPLATPQISKWALCEVLEWIAKPFEPADLDGAHLVIAATSAPGVNAAVFQEAEARKIFCNAVDDLENCHFYYGSVVQRGDLQIAISTNGKSPALAQRLRKQLELQFGPEYESWLELLGAARETLRAAETPGDPETTKRLLHQLASEKTFEQFRQQSKNPAAGKGIV